MAPIVSKDPVVETPAPSSPVDSEEEREVTYAPRETNDDYVPPPIRTATPPPAVGEGDGDREQVRNRNEKQCRALLYCTLQVAQLYGDGCVLGCGFFAQCFSRNVFSSNYFRLRSARGGGGDVGPAWSECSAWISSSRVKNAIKNHLRISKKKKHAVFVSCTPDHALMPHHCRWCLRGEEEIEDAIIV